MKTRAELGRLQSLAIVSSSPQRSRAAGSLTTPGDDMNGQTSRILIAGLGNVFLGDDGFGIEVANKLLEDPPPGDVYIVDFGARGSHLVFALLDDYDLVILIDAARRGRRPGDIYLLEPDIPLGLAGQPAEGLFDPHNMDPAGVVRLVATMGGRIGRLLLVGCEPMPIGRASLGDGLSEPVHGAVDCAVGLIHRLVAQQQRDPMPAREPLSAGSVHAEE